MNRAKTMNQIVDVLTHTTDGPITAFVLVGRACDAVKAGADATLTANALYDELQARGMLSQKGEEWQ